MRVGIPTEVYPGERRAAGTPDTVTRLIKLGFTVAVQRGAGAGARIPDEAYARAGAELVDDAAALWGSADLLLKVRPPMTHPELGCQEASLLKEGATLISTMFPADNAEAIEALIARKATAVALESIPRTTVAQKMDVLSSMANIAGYRAVVEAANAYGGFFSGQITAAGSTRPARVLVIGAGVAGLAAIGAARGLGAEVRAFDTRPATRLEVESLGATFLELDFKEGGEGGGGYAKVMSEEFIRAEMDLFRKQAAEVDVIITTALIPGRRAPLLLPEDVVVALKPGSVVVDLAAEQGGNCALTTPGEARLWRGITIVGYTDMTSRQAAHASQFFGSNLAHLLKHMGGAAGWKLDMEDMNVRPAFLLAAGERLPPPPRVDPTPAAKPAVVAPTTPEKVPERRSVGGGIAGMVAAVGLATLGLYAPTEFLQHFTVFVLACFVGWQVIWNVSPALHTPLMSVTNAISGIIIVGGMLQLGGGEHSVAAVLGAVAVLLASINIAGGFFVTQRMLRMFHKGDASRA